jgi:thioredoxin 1
MADGVGVLTEATFDEELGASVLPVLVEFWAEWCPPCKALAPVLDSVAVDHGDRLRLYKVNSDESPELAARFAVSSLPTLLVFRDGSVVKRMVGARGKRHLLEELADVVS